MSEASTTTTPERLSYAGPACRLACGHGSCARVAPTAPCAGGCGARVRRAGHYGTTCLACAPFAGPVCVGACRHGSCVRISPKVPCTGCGLPAGRATTTGRCRPCVQIMWQTGELAHPKQENRTLLKQTPAYVSGAKRFVRGLGVRIGAGADIENLARLAEVRDEVDRVERITVRMLREHGYSWADIGRQVGTTRQAAQLRFGPYMSDQVADREAS